MVLHSSCGLGIGSHAVPHLAALVRLTEAADACVAEEQGRSFTLSPYLPVFSPVRQSSSLPYLPRLAVKAVLHLPCFAGLDMGSGDPW